MLSQIYTHREVRRLRLRDFEYALEPYKDLPYQIIADHVESIRALTIELAPLPFCMLRCVLKFAGVDLTSSIFGIIV
jgi:hypothetical protein